jgi:FHS family L-fucose permease-like MFS transporter
MASVSSTGMSSVGSAGSESRNRNYKMAFAVITSLFFIFGFITCLNDILVPHLKSLFKLDYTQAALVQFCFFSAYFIASLPAGRIVTRLGYKQGTVLGLLITAVGCLMFYPAAGAQSYNLFLTGLFVLACGITLIQVAVNPYITVLGPAKTASARLTLAQAFNSLGTTIAPMFGSYLILSTSMKSDAEVQAADAATQAAYKVTQASSVQGPYIGLALALVALAVLVALFRLPKIDTATNSTAQSTAGKSAWAHRHLILGAVGIFCYVGAEVAIGSYLVNFLSLGEVGGMAPAEAAKYVSLYWGGAMVGRFIGAFLMRKIQPGKLLAFNAACAAVLVLVTMAVSGPLAMGAILAVGLFNSIMFPTIFALAIEGLGEATAQGSGILCMAIVGGAIIPLIQGSLADHLGLHHSYVLPVLCYIFIVHYGLKGHLARATQTGIASSTGGLAVDAV